MQTNTRASTFASQMTVWHKNAGQMFSLCVTLACITLMKQTWRRGGKRFTHFSSWAESTIVNQWLRRGDICTSQMTKTNSCWQHKKVQRHVDQDCRPAPWEVSGTWPIVATVLRATSSLGLCPGFPLILILSIIFWASHGQEEGSLESPIYFSQMMWFCWCHLVVSRV